MIYPENILMSLLVIFIDGLIILLIILTRVLVLHWTNYMPHIVPACMYVNYYNTMQNICLGYMWLGGRVFEEYFVYLPRLITILYQI